MPASAGMKIRFEECTPTSVVIVLEYEDQLLEEFLGCRLWHRNSAMKDYPEKPTYIVLRPEKRFKVTDLDPSTEYFCKVSLFSSARVLGVWEAKWLTPSLNRGFILALDYEHIKTNLMLQENSQMDSTNSNDTKMVSCDHSEKLRSLDDINKNKNTGFHMAPASMEVVPLLTSSSVPPSTPSKSDKMHEVLGLVGKKQMRESDYEYSVRVIKWLECQGHIAEDFRIKFLTWFSLKATLQERRVVSVFVDTLIDDPPSLAEQLIHSFMDEICYDQKSISKQAFCTSLWH